MAIEDIRPDGGGGADLQIVQYGIQPNLAAPYPGGGPAMQAWCMWLWRCADASWSCATALPLESGQRGLRGRVSQRLGRWHVCGKLGSTHIRADQCAVGKLAMLCVCRQTISTSPRVPSHLGTPQRPQGSELPAAYWPSCACISSMTVRASVASLPPAEQMIENLVKAHETVVRTAREVFPVAEDANDEPSADLLTQRMQISEKTAWMLRSMVS